MGSDELVLGRLGAPFGLKGHLRFTSYSGETAHIAKLKDVVLRDAAASSAAGRPGRGESTARVASVINAGSGVAIKFEGYESPETARALTGFELVAPRSKAAPLRKNEFYVTDLEGAALVYGSERVATVDTVVDGGGGQLLECRLPDGRERFVPFRAEFVGKVDVAAKTVELLVDWILDADDSAEIAGGPGDQDEGDGP